MGIEDMHGFPNNNKVEGPQPGGCILCAFIALGIGFFGLSLGAKIFPLVWIFLGFALLVKGYFDAKQLVKMHKDKTIHIFKRHESLKSRDSNPSPLKEYLQSILVVLIIAGIVFGIVSLIPP